jgi:hypothetical protein
MPNVTQGFGTANQALTITIASLANGSSRQSTVVDNGTNLFTDALVAVKIRTGASGTTATGVVVVYAFGTVDGSTYSENAGASDAAITLTSNPNVRIIGIVNCVANSTTYYSPVFSVASAFGGVMPSKWGIIITNGTGGALDATGGNHSAIYQGVYTIAA